MSERYLYDADILGNVSPENRALCESGPRGINRNQDGRSLPALPAANGNHVYAILLRDGTLPTVGGGATRVLYIGQGGSGRVHQLWEGQHSATKSIGRAHFARTAGGLGPLHLEVVVKSSAQPELEEMRALNRFVLQHGQLPAFNGRFEGWLAPRVLEAVAARLQFIGGLPPGPLGRAYAGPRTPANKPRTPVGEQRRFTFTGLDLYGEPPPDKPWRWLGTLLWVWPKSWMSDADRRLIDAAAPILPGSILLIVPHPGGENNDWHPIPALICGEHKWSGSQPMVRVLERDCGWIGGEGSSTEDAERGFAGLLGTTPDTPDSLAHRIRDLLPKEGWDG